MSELKPGDKVIMNGKYHVVEKHEGVVFVVRSAPWYAGGTKVVLLQGRAGGYAVNGLIKIDPAAQKEGRI